MRTRAQSSATLPGPGRVFTTLPFVGALVLNATRKRHVKAVALQTMAGTSSASQLPTLSCLIVDV
eukprot:scaffold8988_cov112-Isochrysis_galbana.AAC.2